MQAVDVLYLVVLAAIWGASFLFMRVAAPEFGPVALIEMRVILAALFLLPVLWSRGRRRGLGEMRANAGPMLVVGVINSAVPFSLLAYATLSLTAGFASILNATAPFFAAIVAYVWLRDRLPPSRVIGLVVGFAGVAVLVWGRASFKPGGGGLAVTAGLAAGLSYGVSANYTKRYLTGVSALATATGSQVGAALALLPFALVSIPGSPPSPRAWAMVVALAVVCTGVAYLIYFRLIARIGPARTVAVTFLIPAFGVLWGRLFLREPVTGQMLAGAAIVLTGTALATGFVKVSRSRS